MASDATQKAILKLILSLPSPILRAMSGGGVGGASTHATR